MKIKTSKLTDAALDWAVGMSDGGPAKILWRLIQRGHWKPSTYWAQGGPIKSNNRISTVIKHDGWWIAFICDLNDEKTHMQLAKDELTAAMRCYVDSELGDVVDVPDELVKE